MTVTVAILVAGWAVGVNAAPAVAAPSVSATQTACSLLTHSQVVGLIDAPRFKVMTSTSSLCYWSTPGLEQTSNSVTLSTKHDNPSNTSVDRSEASICAGYVVKHIDVAGETGFYCISTEAISSANMIVQEDGVQIAIMILYGFPKFKVNASHLVADGKVVLRELRA